ncbi:hypothetical protein [Spirosoma foliorum]|uniref:Uncharacterized protein n=1 Tax=Spirosoma foliorum TaxID=2710596 RepID=A0A7G5H0A2_9BACT|nr:hypothetical protein [Spirosoma foliorum]QMW04544.1 hypothetical protein H3H32_06285 [Spirosoma foliorum]
MKPIQLSEQQVLKKIQKRLKKVIKSYEKVIVQLESQLEKINQLPDQQEVATLRETMLIGLNQSRKFLEKANEDHKKVMAQRAKLQFIAY